MLVYTIISEYRQGIKWDDWANVQR